MSRYFKVPIAVKPYVKKYIERIYGDRITISKENPTSILLYNMLQKKRNYLFNLPGDSFDLKAQTDHISLMIPRRATYRIGIFYSQKHQFIINHYFEQRIIESIYLESLSSTKIKAVQTFCAAYGIETDEDVNEENLLRRVYLFERKLQMQRIAREKKNSLEL